MINENTSVNELRNSMVTLAEQKEALKTQLKEIDSKLDTVLKALGVGEVFQGSDGTVFRIEKPSGKFISFPEISYVRTRKAGEKGGNYLAKKEAEELGFTLSK
jgi:hypothetical protein